ncbi:energy-coupling factor ABC transporter substrate-binding protein [Streptomonospora sp. PA3]|uniref:energy-coupling factor ABC transporter substrate-binding protein n=1 Tax=Streptomonospora sp. PA3 TaxID=2607326 RepID=UPI0012DC8DD5|nr:energy-coupling factor ABC transporter substrate-binding protein [Streptomonospora sp. PA3]MUL43138.1 energy-coupling factor ABC transporter substrate-binding protein [Streptomonospora sp. PA3]
MPKTTTTWMLIALAALIAALPLLIGSGNHLEEPFAGADAQAKSTVTEVDEGYEPWFAPIYEPPSAEIESGIFALQAAIGAGFIGYFFGVVRTRTKLARPRAEAPDAPDAADAARSAEAEPGSAER